MKPAQKHQVLSVLKEGGTLTPMAAWETLKITRLAAIIHELRKEGYTLININPKGKHAIYKLVNEHAA